MTDSEAEVDEFLRDLAEEMTKPVRDPGRPMQESFIIRGTPEQIREFIEAVRRHEVDLTEELHQQGVIGPDEYVEFDQHPIIDQ